MPAPPSRAQQAARDAAVARNNAAQRSAVGGGLGGTQRTDRAPAGGGNPLGGRPDSPAGGGGRPSGPAGRAPLGGALDRISSRERTAAEDKARTDRQPPQVGLQRPGSAPQIPTPRQNPLSDTTKFHFPRGRDYTFLGRTDIDAPGKVPSEITSALVKAQEKYGDTYTITSGYRGPKLNAPKTKANPFGVGGATASQHLLGKAFDIHVKDKSPEAYARLSKSLSDVGFKGFGGYGYGSIHADFGPERSWGAKAKDVMSAVRSKTVPSARVASKSPFAPPSAQAATPSVPRPRPKPQGLAAEAAARAARKTATVGLPRRDPFEGVSSKPAPRATVQKQIQDRLPTKDQSRIPPGDGQYSAPQVRSRSPGPKPQQPVSGPKTRSRLPDLAPSRSRSPFSPIAPARSVQQVTGPRTRGPLPSIARTPKAPHGLISNALRARIAAKEAAEAAKKKAPATTKPAPQIKRLAPSFLNNLKSRFVGTMIKKKLKEAGVDVKIKEMLKKVGIDTGSLFVMDKSGKLQSLADVRGGGGRDRKEEEKKRTRKAAQVAARSTSPFLFPPGPSYPAS